MAARIMIVDDDPLALRAVAHTVHHYLPTVAIETFSTPHSALLQLDAQSFAVVLTDFNMPGMNGLGLLKIARERGSDASFIVMTGDSTEDILTEGLRLGLFALVDKPLNRLSLIPVVQQAAECHRLRQEIAGLRKTLIDSGVELGNLMRSLIPESDEVVQPTLPY